MNYTPITEENVEKAATLYMNHYNQHSGGCWTCLLYTSDAADE